MRRRPPRPPTSARALRLAAVFRTANEELIAFAEHRTDEQWHRPCPREGRTLGQVVEHVAAGHLVIGGIVEAMACGEPLPVAARRTEATGARYNARQAERFAGHKREQAVRALRRNGAVLERFVAGLTDDELDRAIATPAGAISVAREIEGGLLGHLRSHFEALRETIEPA